MFWNQFNTKKILVSIITISLLASCAPPAPQIIEITRVIPETIVITQVITQIVTPEITPTLTETPTSTYVPAAIIQPSITPIPTLGYGDTQLLRKDGFYVHYPIDGCGPSIVRRGFRVYVSYVGGKNALRSTADIATPHNIIGYALPGEFLKIIGGPVCNYGWLLWQVETEYGMAGWTPESNGTDFWLIPSSESE